jgi:imidazolonepropionase
MLILSALIDLSAWWTPQRGAHLGEWIYIPDVAVYLQDDAILQVGTSADLLQRFPDEARLDAHRLVVMPGFVDPHTHHIWAGDRANEFTQRLEGKSYMEIHGCRRWY